MHSDLFFDVIFHWRCLLYSCSDDIYLSIKFTAQWRTMRKETNSTHLQVRSELIFMYTIIDFHSRVSSFSLIIVGTYANEKNNSEVLQFHIFNKSFPRTNRKRKNGVMLKIYVFLVLANRTIANERQLCERFRDDRIVDFFPEWNFKRNINDSTKTIISLLRQFFPNCDKSIIDRT